ncbi:MAG: extracellular solute-binding protein [Synechococcales bacterium]|nr:extracellular solute-binding protein [Synechococcales bacterium]
MVKRSRSWYKLRKALHSRGVANVWGQLAIAQLALLGLLYWTWPPVSLTLVVPAAEVPYWSDIIQAFEADHPHIRIRPIGLNNPQGDITVNLKELCTLEVPERSLCDIIYLDVIWVPELAARGWLRNLDDQVSATELAQFVDSEVAAGRYGQGLYRIPFRADFGMLYYRADLLQQAGYAPPDRFQDLLRIAQDLQAQGAAPWGYLWQSQREGLVAAFVEVLHGHGGYWIDPETRAVGLDEPEAIAAVEFLLETIALGVSPPLTNPYTDAEAFQAFLAGEAVFMRNWPYVLGLDEAAASPLRNQIQRIPMALHAPGETGGGCKGSWGLGIARRSQHPQQAWRAVQYFTSEAAQRRFVQRTSYVPSRKALIPEPMVIEAAEQAVLRPPIAEYANVSLILQDYLGKVLRGQFAPDVAMRTAAEQTRLLLERTSSGQ